jgi:hypothetical protein
MDLLTLIVAGGSILGGVLGKLLVGEIVDWIPTIAHRIVDRAVNRLPEQERSRYREEWYAHIDDCPGKLGKLWHAAGCLRGSTVIARAISTQVADSRSARTRSDDHPHEAQPTNQPGSQSIRQFATWRESWRLYEQLRMFRFIDEQTLRDLGLTRGHLDMENNLPPWLRRLVVKMAALF